MSAPSSSRRGPFRAIDPRPALQNTHLGGRPLAWYVGGWRLGLLIFILMLAYPFAVGNTFVAYAIPVGIYVILAVGLNMVVGYAGLLDLGYVAFFAIGSYVIATGTYGSLTLDTTTGKSITLPIVSFWLLLGAGALIAGIFGAILGAPTLRLRGDYLAIVTLGFGEIVPILFNYFPYWNGNTGITPRPPADIIIGGLDISFSDPLNRTPYYYVVLVVAVLVILASISLRDSSLGRAWVAIREDETAAASSGVSLVRTKLLAFGLGATLGGLGGVLYGGYIPDVSPASFPFQVSITVLLMIVLGGLGSIWGVVVGAALLEIASGVLYQASGPIPFLANLASQYPRANLLFFGLLLIVMILFRPQGLIPDVRRRRELRGIGAAVEGTAAVGILAQEEAGAELTPVDTLDTTTYSGPGADDIGRSGD